MTTKHNISRASEVYVGGAYHPGVFAAMKRVGAKVGTLYQYNLGAPSLGAVDTLATAQAVAAAGALTLAATTLDVPRAVSVTSSGIDTARVFTITGTDAYGTPVVETITGVNVSTVAGKKAFKTIVSVESDDATAGNISVGDADVLGLPVRLNSLANVLAVHAGATEELATSTVVVGDATAATATTGDVRGTVDPATALDGSTAIIVTMFADASSGAALGGVEQYAG